MAKPASTRRISAISASHRSRYAISMTGPLPVAWTASPPSGFPMAASASCPTRDPSSISIGCRRHPWPARGAASQSWPGDAAVAWARSQGDGEPQRQHPGEDELSEDPPANHVGKWRVARRGREDFGERLQPLAQHADQQHDHDAGSGSLRGPAPPRKDGESGEGGESQEPVEREPEAEARVVSRPPEGPAGGDGQT